LLQASAERSSRFAACGGRGGGRRPREFAACRALRSATKGERAPGEMAVAVRMRSGIVQSIKYGRDPH
jgi:hypothetical protein